MTREKAFQRLEEIDREVVMLEHMGSVLSWDQEMGISEKGLEERSLQMGWLASQAHEKACNSEMGDLLSALGADRQNVEGSGKDAFEKALIRIRFRHWDKHRSMSVSLVRAISEKSSTSHESWVQARKSDDWNLFKGDLEEIIALVREKESCYRREGFSGYDVLLDDFEGGMKSSEVEALFSSIKGNLVSLVDTHSDKGVEDDFLRLDYPIAQQEEFSQIVLKDMGFDFSRGSRSVSVHPFTSTLGSDDIRITTRYTDPSVLDSFSSTVHEGGHALYEMGMNSGRQKGTSVANAASHGMHESQSRLWENMVAKGEGFWTHYYPLFCTFFPSQTEGVSLTKFLQAANKVQRSLIRVNADEVSYSLHVMLRFELEQELLFGSLTVDDLPEAWNAKSQQLLGVVPKTYAQGVLQDVHWSSGDFGYFPTYALGNLYGSQIWERMQKDLNVDSLLEQGKLQELHSYLNERIYTKGSLLLPKDLLLEATGKPLDAKLFTSYLEDKFSRLFGN
ncbi:MAG TPA: carboxypeptidase M32 [Sphaerochaeta sp.]|nr:carboxypeptidase M32 [Sphaerochaeta sp.]